MRNVTVSDKQTLLDISVAKMGDLDSVFDLARLNNMAVTDVINSGDVLQVADAPADEDVVNEFTARKFKPATADVELILGGIDYMGIQIDFIVS
jgi:hypothetical protein